MPNLPVDQTLPPAAPDVPLPAAVPGVVPSPHEPSRLVESEARRADLIWSALMVGALAAVFLLLSLFSGVGVPVLLALAVAYALNPVVTWLSSRRMSRTAATVISFAALLLAGAGFVTYLIPVFRDEAAKLPTFFERAATQLAPWVQEHFGVSVPSLVAQRTAELGSQAAALLKEAGPTAAKLLASAAGNTARVLATLVGLLVVPVLAFFFVRDYPRLVESAQRLIPRRSVGLIGHRFAEIDEVLSAFVRGQLTVGAILSTIYATGLSIARIDMAILIGLIAGFGNMVPYLGTAIGVALALLGLMLSWLGPWQAVVVALTFVIGQAAEGLVITPRVVGHKVGLPPVAVIVAVLAFGELFGFVGVLLAVPASAVLKVVGRVLIERYQRMPVYTGEVTQK